MCLQVDDTAAAGLKTVRIRKTQLQKSLNQKDKIILPIEKFEIEWTVYADRNGIVSIHEKSYIDRMPPKPVT